MHVPPPVQLETSDFTLRCWSDKDTVAFTTALAVSDAHLRAWTPWVIDGRVPGLSLDERLRRHAAAFVSSTEWVYGMFSPDGTEVLGGCGLYPRVGPGAVEIGYWLAVAHTGRGLATSATALLTGVAFASPDIERVEIRCDPRNVASARVPERLGYTHASGIGDAAGPGARDHLMTWCLTRAEFSARPGAVPAPPAPSTASAPP